MTHATEPPEDERETLPPPGPPTTDRRRELRHEIAHELQSYALGAASAHAGVQRMGNALVALVDLADELEGVSSL